VNLKRLVRLSLFPLRRVLPLLSLALLFATLFAVLFVAPSAAGAAAAAQTFTPVTLLLDWTPNTNHTGIYVALEKGWYAEEGLELKLLTPGEGGSVEQLVAAGKVNFGISFQEWVTNARAAGLPLVSVAALIQHNTSGFASLKEKGLTRPRDFAGRLYGGWGSPMETAILSRLVESDGGDFGRVKQVTVGEGDLLVMLQRDIDLAWIFYGWQGIEAKRRGLALNVVMLRDYVKAIPDYYTPVLVTNEALIARNPDLIRRFVRATSRGYAFAIRNPREAADLLVRRVPEIKPELAQESQAWLSPRYQEDAPKWGYQRGEVWQRFADWMYENKLLGKRLDMSRAFTNAFLP
jgi:ABC-type nitrate/sulfonate/bicarbonate transport system substrate-binding protein